jgi:hypothetical protein
MTMIVVSCPHPECPVRTEFDPRQLPEINYLEFSAHCPKMKGVIGNPPMGSLSPCETFNRAVIEVRTKFLERF